MVGREAAIRARRYNQPAFNNSMRDSANAAAAFCGGSTGVQEPCSVSGVAEDRGDDAQTRIDCRGSNALQIILFEIQKVIWLAFLCGWHLRELPINYARRYRATSTPEPALAVLAAWLGFFGLGWYGPWVAYLAETAPANKVRLTLGAAMALNQLGIIAAPPLLGLVHDLTGGYAALWACVVAMLGVAYVVTRIAAE
jgi:MFS family permease